MTNKTAAAVFIAAAALGTAAMAQGTPQARPELPPEASLYKYPMSVIEDIRAWRPHDPASRLLLTSGPVESDDSDYRVYKLDDPMARVETMTCLNDTPHVISNLLTFSAQDFADIANAKGVSYTEAAHSAFRATFTDTLADFEQMRQQTQPENIPGIHDYERKLVERFTKMAEEFEAGHGMTLFVATTVTPSNVKDFCVPKQP